MSDPLDLSTKSSVLCVEFKYGDPTSWTIVAYTDNEENVTTQGSTTDSQFYTSEPKIEIKSQKYTIGFKEQPWEVTLPRNSFALWLSDGLPKPKIYVSIYELIDASQILTLFRGHIRTSRRDSKIGKVLFDVYGLKSTLDFPLQLTADHQCYWTFGDSRTCKVDITELSKTVSLDTLNGKESIVSGSYEIDTEHYWHRGSMSKDGIIIGIRKWIKAEPTRFHLNRQPPASWEGENVLITPGCGKNLQADCKGIWENDPNFGGMGVFIPAYSPSVEDPGDEG